MKVPLEVEGQWNTPEKQLLDTHNMQVSQSLGLSSDGLVIKDPRRQEMGIQSLGQEDHLAVKRLCSSTLA